MYEMPEERPTGMAALMQDPMFTLGASLLASAGGQAGPVGRGLMGGIAGYQAQQSNNTLQEYRRAQAEEARRKAIAEQMRQVQRQRLIAQFPPQLQALAEASPELFDKVIERQMGLNTPWYVTPEGIDPRALEYAKAGATNINNFPGVKEGYQYETTPEGKVTAAPVPGGPADPKTPKAPTETQRKAAGWYERMSAVEPEIETLETKLGKGGLSSWDYYTAQTPLTNALASEGYQKYLQKSRDWISGILRYESGAAVPETEFWRYYQTFFATPGDAPSVIEEKRKARKRAAEGIRVGAGSSASGDIPPPPPGFTEALP